jgi:TBC domain-containing protein kinase-like protein
VDIPPVVRGDVWAAVLRVGHEHAALYASVDKDSPAPVDGQLDRDIPRCHQVRCAAALFRCPIFCPV